MLIVRVTEPTGIYTYLAIRAGQFARGRPAAVVMSLALSTALLSAYLRRSSRWCLRPAISPCGIHL